jgi:hypothetical protein
MPVCAHRQLLPVEQLKNNERPTFQPSAGMFDSTVDTTCQRFATQTTIANLMSKLVRKGS